MAGSAKEGGPADVELLADWLRLAGLPRAAVELAVRRRPQSPAELVALVVSELLSGEAAGSGSRAEPAGQRLARAATSLACQGGLWLGPQSELLPGRVIRWLGPRLWWLPAGLPPARSVALLSSRLPRLLHPKHTWLKAVGTLMAQLVDASQWLISASGTAGQQLLIRAAELAGLPAVIVQCCDVGLRPAGAWAQLWLQWLVGRQAATGPATEHTERRWLWALPAASVVGGSVPATLQSVPERDRAAAAWAERIVLIHVRPQGHVHRLAMQALAERVQVQFIDHAELIGPNVRNELIGAAALPLAAECRRSFLWLAARSVPDAKGQPRETGAQAVLGVPSAVPGDRQALGSGGRWRPGLRCRLADRQIAGELDKLAAVLASGGSAVGGQEPGGRPVAAPISLAGVRDAEPWQFLTHTTRAQPGPWPGQEPRDYLDDLLLDRADGDHRAFAALARIVLQRLLVASGRAIRGGYRMVCFTAVPLAQLAQLRVFRTHRGRWDFEPYGICIRRDWLQRRGARPVLYGDETLWHRLAERDRPFFQVACSRTRGGAVLDWTAEQEWRCLGDLDLSELAETDAIVFVADAAEALALAPHCPWPVTLLDTAQPAAAVGQQL